jgi:hypothetical protein
MFGGGVDSAAAHSTHWQRAGSSRLRSEIEENTFVKYLSIYHSTPRTLSPEAMADMQGLVEESFRSGTLVLTGGLLPVKNGGARVRASGGQITIDGLSTEAKELTGGQPTVTDGPFIESKEVIGGYWMIQVKSKAEAIEWASRCPGLDNEVIEIRQVHEMSDFPPDVQKAAGHNPT